MGKIMLNGVDYSSIGGSSSQIDKSFFMGKDTNFVTSFQNGGDANTYKTEYHGFVFNMSNTPENYGFLDVTKFDGSGFSPSPQGVIRQVFTTWNSGVQHVRCFYNNAWSNWRKSADENNLVKKNGDAMNGNLSVVGSSSEMQLNVENNFASGRMTATTAGNFGLYESKNNYWVVKGDNNGNVSIGQRGHDIIDGRTGKGVPIFTPLNFSYSSLTGAKQVDFENINSYVYTTAILYFQYKETTNADENYLDGSFFYANIPMSTDGKQATTKHISAKTYISIYIFYNTTLKCYTLNLISTNGYFSFNGILFC